MEAVDVFFVSSTLALAFDYIVVWGDALMDGWNGLTSFLFSPLLNFFLVCAKKACANMVESGQQGKQARAHFDMCVRGQRQQKEKT